MEKKYVHKCWFMVPINEAGLHAVEYPGEYAPENFFEVALVLEELNVVEPVLNDMNDKFGILIDYCEEEDLPAEHAAEALRMVLAFRDGIVDEEKRRIVEKILPVFEKAATTGMPVVFWL